MGCVESLTKNNHRVETLHVNGVFAFTKSYLSAISTYLPEGAMDVEVCPKCDEVRMIPACSRGSCKQRKTKERKCRGCQFCIPRCVLNVGLCFLSAGSVINHIAQITVRIRVGYEMFEYLPRS